MAEQQFFDEGNCRVTSSRIVVEGTTYSTANVTSVRAVVHPPDRGCAGKLIALGALGTLGSLVMAETAPGSALGTLVIALLVIAGGVQWLRSLKPAFTVYLNTTAGEQQALTTTDEDVVDRFRLAVESAIVARG